MSITTANTVGELAVEFPNAARVFEKLGIDYCCGGSRSLEEACAASKLSAREVLETIAATGLGAPGHRDWQSEPLADLVAHIIGRHHKYTREEIARLGPLFDKVCSVHGTNHPELFSLRSTFQALAEELLSHMAKEEIILFPHLIRMEEAFIEKAAFLPPPFGTVKNPVRMMMHEHDGAAEALRDLRSKSASYTSPPDACTSYRMLFKALEEFEGDLHQHIHLENNILFPRAIKMELGQ